MSLISKAFSYKTYKNDDDAQKSYKDGGQTLLYTVGKNLHGRCGNLKQTEAQSI